MNMRNLMIALALSGAFTCVSALQYSTIATSPVPLVLKAQGSFYLGGERESQTKD